MQGEMVIGVVVKVPGAAAAEVAGDVVAGAAGVFVGFAVPVAGGVLVIQGVVGLTPACGGAPMIGGIPTKGKSLPAVSTQDTRWPA